MLTSFRGLMAVTLATAGLSLATPAMAQSEDSGFTTSANVALTTDYRFRGVSLSGGDPAVQGGFDAIDWAQQPAAKAWQPADYEEEAEGGGEDGTVT